MTRYNVHLCREVRLFFPGIEADTPEEAAKTAAEKATDEAECAEDCEGENLAALVDVVGDGEFTQSVITEFGRKKYNLEEVFLGIIEGDQEHGNSK